MTARWCGYIHPTEILSWQANMQVLPNGNVFIGWGSARYSAKFTEDGELIFNGRFPAAGVYRATGMNGSDNPPSHPLLLGAERTTPSRCLRAGTARPRWRAGASVGFQRR